MRKLLGRLILKIIGWTWDKEKPANKKYIITVAPHTSWTDFIYGSLFGMAVGLRTKVMMKKEMFKFPMGIFLRLFGAIPVDRTRNKHLADQMIVEFDKRKKLVLVIAPEGTRKKVKRWKKGFIILLKRLKFIYILHILTLRKNILDLDLHFFHQETMKRT